jgi:hypothetical protein
MIRRMALVPLEYMSPLPPGSPEGAAGKTYLGQSVIAVIFFWPFGIVALTFSVMAGRANARRDFVSARAHGARAAAWGMAAFAAWVLLLIAIFLSAALFPSLL